MGDVEKKKGRVCVTGASGFVESWIVKKLLQNGYSVNATVDISRTENKTDLSYLTNLPGAAERLQLLATDLDNGESFSAAVEGCIGVFHHAHLSDHSDAESEETKLERVVSRLHAILQACLDSKTVKRVVYTSSITAVAFSKNAGSIIDESCWTDEDIVRGGSVSGGSYAVAKTVAERAAHEFAEKNGLDLVSVIPAWTTGPFLCPSIPSSVYLTMALIFGDKKQYRHVKDCSLVHVDDVARAHIFLFEKPDAKGRYICSALDITIDKLSEFISSRYPEYPAPDPDSWKDGEAIKVSGLSSRKLLDAGFKCENGLEEMFDGAIHSCKQKGFL